MVYAFQMDVPINAEVYAKIKEAIGDDVPRGLISHVVVEREDGRLRYIDVWESEDDWERFSDERLHPVIDRIFSEVGMSGPRVEPDRSPLTVHDVWGPMSARATAVG
jgi:hypothetical protein